MIMHLQFRKVYLCLLIVLSLTPTSVRATGGLPGTSQFGYGVRVDLQGNDPQSAIREAGNFNLDWVAVDFDWAARQPEAVRPPDWGRLDQALESAVAGEVSVMISITNAPPWAMLESGPHPEKTANLVTQLANRYPGVCLALELFPMANTQLGWGSQPDPQAYANLLQASAQSIQASNPEIVLVAGGLTPSLAPTDIDDKEFLTALYQTGTADYISVLGIRLPPLGSPPLTNSHDTDELVLRHYEEIRNIMTTNGHKNGLIWITGFSWDDNALPSSAHQADWLKQAYLLFRAQLYIGAAFFDSLNTSTTASTVLLGQDGNYHPGFEELIQIIAQDHNSQSIEILLDLYKKRIRTNNFKGN